MLKGNSFLFSLLKGVIITLILSLLLVCIFAFFIKAFSFPNGVIKPINVLIKTIAVFSGCLFSVTESKGFLKGLVIGLVSIIVTYLVFGLIAGGITFNLSLLWEVLLGVIVGAIAGALAVNVKKQ